MVVTSFCLFLLGGCISRLVSDFSKAGFGWFQKSVVGIVQTGQWCSAGSVPKRSKQRSSVKSKGSHNKSFKRTRWRGPLNSSVMQNREVQNPKTKPDLDDSRIRENSVLWVVLLGGSFSGWFLKQVKMVVTSFCLFLLGGCISRWVSDFSKAAFVGFKKSVVGNVQTGQWWSAGSVPKRLKQRSSVKSKGSHNKSFNGTALRAAR